MTLTEVALSDPTVYRFISEKRTHEEIICALVLEKGSLLTRLVELDSIRPRKYRTPDGSIMVWQCPMDLIPEEKL